MGKRSRIKSREQATSEGTDAGAVGPRQPCPCGSGKRYKACHGAAGGEVYVGRPFAGLTSEADIVALRELVPAASAPLRLRAHPEREVLLCTLLPGAAPAMVRDSGAIWLGLQVQHNFGDPARDLGAVLEKAVAQALAGEPGVIGLTDPPGAGPRLQDLIEDAPLDITVHDGFGFWIADVEGDPEEMAAALEQANTIASPTARLTEVDSAYWTRMGAKEHLRWAMTAPEDQILDALAILHASGDDVLVEGARLVGMFRAHGVVVPVWDLPLETGPEAIEAPAAAFGAAFDAAVAEVVDGRELTAEERAARNGLANRQVTIR